MRGGGRFVELHFRNDEVSSVTDEKYDRLWPWPVHPQWSKV